MSKIRSKRDVETIMDEFESIFKYDRVGLKHYVFFQEKETGDTLTIMKYSSGAYTLNRKSEIWTENGETDIDHEKCAQLIWKNRVNINQVMGQLAK